MGDLNRKGTKNEAEGSAKEMKGKVKGKFGDAVDNADTHASGRAEEMKGKVQKNFGKAERALDPDKNKH